eukprot:6305096-Alexandrium_andersonii.AAC.1
MGSARPDCGTRALAILSHKPLARITLAIWSGLGHNDLRTAYSLGPQTQGRRLGPHSCLCALYCGCLLSSTWATMCACVRGCARAWAAECACCLLYTSPSPRD